MSEGKNRGRELWQIEEGGGPRQGLGRWMNQSWKLKFLYLHDFCQTQIPNIGASPDKTLEVLTFQCKIARNWLNNLTFRDLIVWLHDFNNLLHQFKVGSRCDISVCVCLLSDVCLIKADTSVFFTTICPPGFLFQAWRIISTCRVSMHGCIFRSGDSSLFAVKHLRSPSLHIHLDGWKYPALIYSVMPPLWSEFIFHSSCWNDSIPPVWGQTINWNYERFECV